MNDGYARVSTDHQSLGVQIEALTAAGCAKVFQEKASGARGDRAALRRAIGQLGGWDVLIVTRLDRLARSTRDLLTRSRSAGRVSAPWPGRCLPTPSSDGGLRNADRANQPETV